MSDQPFSILFVCTGNICRSAAAEAMFRQRIRELHIEADFRYDSAGTGDAHVGEAPDARTQATLLTKNIQLDDLRARTIRASDFYDFNVILAMDQSHYDALKKQAPADAKAEISLYLPYAFDKPGNDEVPDPYYGSDREFHEVTEMIDRATFALVRKLTRQQRSA